MLVSQSLWKMKSVLLCVLYRSSGPMRFKTFHLNTIICQMELRDRLIEGAHRKLAETLLQFWLLYNSSYC